MNTIELNTSSRTQLVDITREVQRVVTRSGLADGLAVVCSAHTTAGMTINENADPDVTADLLGVLERMVPHRGPYAHAEGNSDAHVKASLMGLSVAVPVEGGRLVLGTWQGIYFCEFDGPRRRRVYVQLLPAPQSGTEG